MQLFKEPPVTLCLALILLIIGTDQVTKWIATDVLGGGNSIEVLPVLNWTLAHNYGAAFSFLSDAGGWQRWFFTGISVFASVFFMVWLVRLPLTAWLTRYSLTFIIGGAVGNLIDRFHLGYVIDFISVHWGPHYFPTFNVADMAITFGAMLMILDIFLNPEVHNND